MIALCSFLLLQLVVGPERPAAPVRAGNISPQQVVVSTATDGTNQFVVWTDGRNDLPAHTGGLSVVAAARVDAQGNVLDVPNIVLPISPNHGAIYAFWDGHEYVVVTSGEYVRVSAGGELLDRVARTYPIPAFVAYFAWSGDRLLAIDHGWHASLYDASFNPIRQNFVVNFDVDGYENSVASNGDGFLLAGIANFRRDLRMMALDRNGQTIRDTTTLLHSDLVAAPQIASDGRDYMVAFRTATLVTIPYYFSYFTDYTFVALAIHGDGTAFSGGGSFGTPITDGSPADLQWQGDRYSLVYDAAHKAIPSWTYGVDAVELDRNGNVTAANTPLVDGLAGHVKVSNGAGPRMLFWTNEVKPPGVKYAYSLTNGQPYGDTASFASWSSRRFTFGQGSFAQESPAVATAGDVSLLVWRERTSPYDPLVLYTALVGPGGEPVAAPRKIAEYTCDSSQPSVASDGHGFLVGWLESGSVRVMRIAHDGAPIDPTSVSLGDITTPCFGLAPALAFNGTDYLAAYRNDYTVNARRIGTDGTLYDAATIAPIANPRTVIYEMAAATNGSDFAVAWGEGSHVFVTRIGKDGYPRDYGGIPLGLFDLQSFFWTGRNYAALTWDRYQRLGSDGQLVDAKPVVTANLPPFNRPSCNGGTCSMFQVSDGQLLETDYGDTPAGFTIGTKPIAKVDTTDWRSILFFGSARNLAYLRLAPEQPYAGSWHLFVRPSIPPKERAIR